MIGSHKQQQADNTTNYRQTDKGLARAGQLLSYLKSICKLCNQQYTDKAKLHEHTKI